MAATFGKRQNFGPRRMDAPQVTVALPSEPAPVVPTRWPILTVALSTILIGIYVVQQSGSDPGQPFSFNVRAALAWGGVDRYLVLQNREWWRVFTAPWLHGSLDHIIGNLITLFIAGAILERRVGKGWLAAIYVIGGLGGSIGSTALEAPTLISVGASGAIMALVTSVYALSYHAKLEKHAKRLRRMALFILVPAVAPSVAHGGAQIDVGAHFGGFAAGLALAFVLLAMWDETKPTPPAKIFAGAIGAAGFAAVALSFLLVYQHYPIYAARAEALTPLSLLKDEEALERDAFPLSRRYPHDPFIRMVLAQNQLQTRYFQDAEIQARAGLAEREMLDMEFGPVVERRLQMLLAISLLAQKRLDEAKEAAGPVCGISNRDTGDLYAVLTHYGLCT